MRLLASVKGKFTLRRAFRSTLVVCAMCFAGIFIHPSVTSIVVSEFVLGIVYLLWVGYVFYRMGKA